MGASTSGHAVEAAVLGRAARRAAPRSSHADWEPRAGRPDPVETLEEQAATRVQELVPIRYGRMLESPFAFYRGAAGAHARAGDAAATAAYAGRGDALDRALAEFAERYADQNERDYAALASAVRDGRVIAGPALR